MAGCNINFDSETKNDVLKYGILFSVVYCVSCILQGIPIFLIDILIFAGIMLAVRTLLCILEKYRNV